MTASPKKNYLVIIKLGYIPPPKHKLDFCSLPNILKRIKATINDIEGTQHVQAFSSDDGQTIGVFLRTPIDATRIYQLLLNQEEMLTYRKERREGEYSLGRDDAALIIEMGNDIKSFNLDDTAEMWIQWIKKSLSSFPESADNKTCEPAMQDT